MDRVVVESQAARGRQGSFTKVISWAGGGSTVLARMWSPLGYVATNEHMLSAKAAVENVVRALESGNLYFGQTCRVVGAEVEYEDLGRRDEDGDVLLSPSWRVDVVSGDVVANVYVPALSGAR
jgi:hypothetical protein